MDKPGTIYRVIRNPGGCYYIQKIEPGDTDVNKNNKPFTNFWLAWALKLKIETGKVSPNSRFTNPTF